MAATCLKKFERGQQKARKVGGTKEKQPNKHVAASWVNWQQVNNLTGYKKSTLEESLRSKDGQWFCSLQFVSTHFEAV